MFLRAILTSFASLTAAVGIASAEPVAKEVFGAAALPAATRPSSIGFYSKGCLSGGVAIPVDGPDWQVMRLSRNRRWGHPVLIGAIEELSRMAKKDGWNGLMIGDISQPRGGPMLTGHASHQIGLDADIWFTPMPDRRLTYREREELSAISMLKAGTNHVDDRLWTKAHERLLRHAAMMPEVERVLVHPGIKKKLCDSVKGDRDWLKKIRPNWGHNYHFHVRIACQEGSGACRKQSAVTGGEGCDSSLDWWFDVALKPKKKTTQKEKPPRPMLISDMPKACRAVIEAPAKPADQAEASILDASFDAPEIEIPAYDPVAARKSRPIEAKGPTLRDMRGDQTARIVPAEADAATPIPVPTPRPSR